MSINNVSESKSIWARKEIEIFAEKTSGGGFALFSDEILDMIIQGINNSDLSAFYLSCKRFTLLRRQNKRYHRAEASISKSGTVAASSFPFKEKRVWYQLKYGIVVLGEIHGCSLCHLYNGLMISLLFCNAHAKNSIWVEFFNNTKEKINSEMLEKVRDEIVQQAKKWDDTEHVKASWAPLSSSRAFFYKLTEDFLKLHEINNINEFHEKLFCLLKLFTNDQEQLQCLIFLNTQPFSLIHKLKVLNLVGELMIFTFKGTNRISKITIQKYIPIREQNLRKCLDEDCEKSLNPIAVVGAGHGNKRALQDLKNPYISLEFHSKHRNKTDLTYSERKAEISERAMELLPILKRGDDCIELKKRIGILHIPILKSLLRKQIKANKETISNVSTLTVISRVALLNNFKKYEEPLD